MTARQGKAWDAWFRETLLVPGKEAYYLMQVAAEIRRGRVKDPGQVKVEDMRLEFKKDEGARKATSSHASEEGRERQGVLSSSSLMPSIPMDPSSSQEQPRDEGLPPGFPRRMTKEDIARMKQAMRDHNRRTGGG